MPAPRAKKLALLLAVNALLCAAGAEIACRLFWRIRFGIPFLSPDRVLHAFYPELGKVAERPTTRDDGTFDILLLGGSTLNKVAGDVEERLAARFAAGGYINVRIHNLSMPAHTSRDSLLKYAAMDGAHFDIVVLYHGINETRANNVPPALYREGYDHFPWYETVNAMSRYRANARFALPCSLHFLWIRAVQEVRNEDYIPGTFPLLTPRRDWTRYGGNPRSVISLGKNVNSLIDIAATRGDRVLLLTFATFVPKDYSLDRFREKKLAYTDPLMPIEVWGERPHVEAAVAAHNAVIRRIADARREVLFLDMSGRIPKDGRYFRDPCHLTREGSALFAGALFGFLSEMPGFPGGRPTDSRGAAPSAP